VKVPRVRGARGRRITLRVDGRELAVEEGTALAAALWNAGMHHFRTSVRGEPRGPLCAMGTCFECRVTVDGVAHRRSCLLPCRQGMVVETGGETHAGRG
jgi:predicted molibdopterin-dependent oxidoreductase YjgC